jgi:WD40 repeat protein
MNGDYFEQDIKPPVRKRLTQIVIVVLAITSVISLIAVKVFSDQRQQALDKAVAATAQSRSRELAYAALEQVEVDPELGIILATEANQAARTTEAEDALRRSLSASHLRLRLSMSESMPIHYAQFSPDGRSILTSAGGSAQVWERASGRVRLTLRDPDGSISDAEYSRDGGRIFTVGKHGTVRVWRADTGTVLSGFGTADTPFIGRFSSDGQRFAVPTRDGVVRIYDTASGAILANLLVTDTVVLAWPLPDGTSILTMGAYHPAMRVWDSRDGHLRFEANENYRASSFSPDGRYLAAAGSVDVQVWSIDSGQKVCTIPNVTANGVGFSPAGDQLLLNDEKAGRTTLWDLGPPPGVPSA